MKASSEKVFFISMTLLLFSAELFFHIADLVFFDTGFFLRLISCGYQFLSDAISRSGGKLFHPNLRLLFLKRPIISC